ncbi:Ribonuclease G and E [Microbacterium sp. C448]|uniref:Rne/Rng family ribonuclease n=1 Tax=Microbacterium TaxID=33882 RepID=UPI0003DE6EDA|nr:MULTISPECIES: Rne/Rng family ribonuclease [Microbacterium]CDJ99851.1 Ribonuclease G and E [Microbacterium sp. C448]
MADDNNDNDRNDLQEVPPAEPPVTHVEDAPLNEGAPSVDEGAPAEPEGAPSFDEATPAAEDAASQPEESPAEPEAPATESEAPAAEPEAPAAEPAGPAAGAAEPEAPTAEPEAPAPEASEPQAEPEPDPEPKIPTAVALGLLPEVFVSQVSTQLMFYAPEIVPLPAAASDRDDRSERDEPEERNPRESQGTSRRRNRRRAGEETNEPQDASTVVRVRQPRAVEVITEPQRIKGSTRLEAKKQRRRDGREAGRRRAVVTEAEFLARREAVDRDMIVRSKNGRIQIAVLEDNVLVEHYVARNQDASLIGNVYLGRVQNVLPSMEAAFVDIGRGRNAVLYSGEVDWDAVETGNQPRRIELALKSGDRVLVQVTKDPVGHKGARLTSQISLPGRYLVYVPAGSMNGISRKLPDTERARLKRILKEVLPESSGVIVRTAAEGATEDQLTRDVQRLTSQWEHISSQLETVQAPALLHSEPDLLVKIVRDVFNEDFTKMLIQGEEAQRTIEAYLESVAPDLLERVQPYEGDRDPFDEFRVTEQIEKALDRKVWLPSGGSLVIDRTEAMTVVDVNTGKFVGSGGNLEETVTKNNLEAAEEIVRQLRLRDIGGIIVVDFIDMVLESNRDLVLRRLVECLSRDRTKHQVAEVTSLGLVQMTRKKLGLGLLETFSENCEVCAGRGVIVHHDPVVKHRSSSSAPSRDNGGSNRRPRGGNNGSNSGGNGNGGNGGTHVITEGVKSALAQIAASTLGAAPEAESTDAPATAVATVEEVRETIETLESLEIVLPEGPVAPAGDGERKKRRKRPEQRGDRAERGGERGDQRSEQRSVAPKSEKDQLLDSVLQALPEPKAPGQGRQRRRVSTGIVTGTPVTMPSADE